MDSCGQAGKRKAPDDEKVTVDDDDDRTVLFSIRGQDGSKLFFKLRKDTLLIKAFRTYCERKNLEYEATQFLYRGKYVNGECTTPKKLKLKKKGSIIDAMTQQSGGGGAALNS